MAWHSTVFTWTLSSGWTINCVRAQYMKVNTGEHEFGSTDESMWEDKKGRKEKRKHVSTYQGSQRPPDGALDTWGQWSWRQQETWGPQRGREAVRHMRHMRQESDLHAEWKENKQKSRKQKTEQPRRLQLPIRKLICLTWNNSLLTTRACSTLYPLAEWVFTLPAMG